MVTGPFVTFLIPPSNEGDFHSTKGLRPTRAKMVEDFTRIAANAAELKELDALPKVEITYCTRTVTLVVKYLGSIDFDLECFANSPIYVYSPHSKIFTSPSRRGQISTQPSYSTTRASQ